VAGPARILVLDGDTRAALAAVRALGRRGHAVHVASARPGSLAGASRFATGEVALGDAAERPGEWATALEKAARALRIEWVLPVTEIAFGTLFAAGLDARLALLGPGRGAYERAVDKHGLLERAAQLGLDVPRTLLLEDPAALPVLPPAFAYPVVLKPRRSRDARVVRGPEELRTACRAPEARAGLLLQEFVPGHGEAVFALAREGRVLVRFAHRRLREKPPGGGQSVLRESIAPDPGLLAGAEKLLADLRFSGVAMVEFRRAPGGRAPLMELNPRLWGSLQLAIDAGVDFPSLLLALHRGEEIPELEPRPGVRTRWLLGDVDHLLICLRRPAVGRRRGRGGPGRLWDFARSFAEGTRLEVVRRDAWRPFRREIAARLRG
jgi:carbamoylphosphate synthase large subunit